MAIASLASLLFRWALLLISFFPKRKPTPAPAAPKLPPGSMGLPFVGDTPQLYSQDPDVFFSDKQKRYGEVFKTRLLGCRCVMLASPEAAHFVLAKHPELFRPTYPPSKMAMIGPSALFFHGGEYHLRLRRLVQSALADVVRRLLPDVDRAAAAALAAWDGKTASTFAVMKKLAFDVGILVIFGGRLDERYRAELEENYGVVERGYNCVPSLLPGTRYRRAMKARRKLQSVVSEIMAERRAASGGAGGGGDLLEGLMRWEDEEGRRLTEEQVADNVVGVLFAAQDTTASALTWAVKYLHSDPHIFSLVKAEQMGLYEETEKGKWALTWGQTRRMIQTQRFILETLRMASIISFTFREAVVDVEYKGFLIPKGWKVMPLFRNIHHSAEFFQNPQNFDPLRFKEAPKAKTFMPFGSGVHSCPGNEIAKLQMLLVIHHIVTRYRWEAVGSSEGVEYSPFPVPQNGLLAELKRLDE